MSIIRGKFEKFSLKTPYAAPRSIEDLLRILPDLIRTPFVAEWGEFSTPTSTPYRVTFKTKFPQSPAVFCLGSIRRGTLTPPKYTAPTIAIPTVTVPSMAVPSAPTIYIPSVSIPRVDLSTISIPKVYIQSWYCNKCGYGWFTILKPSKCPECSSTDIKEDTSTERCANTGWRMALYNAKKRLGEWKFGFEVLGVWIGIDINWIRDLVAIVFAWTGYHFLGARGAFVLADAISAQVDNITNSINDGFSKARDNTQSAVNTIISSLNSVLSTVRNEVQTRVNQGLADAREKVQTTLDSFCGNLQAAMNDTVAKTNSALKQVTTFSQDSINKAIENIYTMMGLSSGFLATPVAVENVTTDGFTVLGCAGARFFYLAISSAL